MINGEKFFQGSSHIVNHRFDELPTMVVRFDVAACFQQFHGLAQGYAADAEQLGHLMFAGQFIAGFKSAFCDAIYDLFGDKTGNIG